MWSYVVGRCLGVGRGSVCSRAFGGGESIAMDLEIEVDFEESF